LFDYTQSIISLNYRSSSYYSLIIRTADIISALDTPKGLMTIRRNSAGGRNGLFFSRRDRAPMQPRTPARRKERKWS